MITTCNGVMGGRLRQQKISKSDKFQIVYCSLLPQKAKMP
jgi:hypothetical protein